MNIIDAIVLSVIEGITEFLPVSSTGHLILASKVLGITETEFTKSFEIFIQLGAIMAVVSLYMKRVLTRPHIVKPILTAFVPTAVLGAVFYSFIKRFLLSNDLVVIAALAGVGAVIIALERYWDTRSNTRHTAIESLSVRQLIMIGLYQSVSMIPGVSRSAATIIGGQLTGLSRKDAVEFSFLLAVPTMAAATGLDLVKSAHAFTPDEFVLLAVGFCVSWVTALAVISGFVRFVERNTLTGFGVYRIAAAILYLMVFVV